MTDIHTHQEGESMSTTSKQQRTIKRGMWAGALGAAGLLTFSSVAWACTTIMGAATITPTSGRPTTVVTYSAEDLRNADASPPRTYRLRFQDANQVRNATGCHSATILASGIPAPGGAFEVRVTIPRKINGGKTPKGPSKLCGEDEFESGNYGTAHKTFTVL